MFFAPPDNHSGLINKFSTRKPRELNVNQALNSVARILIKKDILEIYPERLFYANFEPREPKFNSLDKWLVINEIETAGASDPIVRPTIGLRVQEIDGGLEYHIDFPLLTYIDHLYIDDLKESEQAN